MTRAIELRTDDSGAQVEGDPRPEGARRRRSALGLPAGRDRPRRGRHADRRRRQHVPRLHRRRRLPERRPLAPAGRGRGAGAAGALLAHRLHDRPLRGLRHAGRAPLRARAGAQAREGGVLQRRHRGRRERGQVRPRLHRPPRGDRLRGRLPRPDAALADADLEDAPVQGGARAVRARGLPRALPERLPRAERGRRAGGARAHAGDAGRRRERRRDRDRAGAGRGRLRGRAAGVPRGRAPDLRRQRHRDGRRRGADRLRPHRQHVGRSTTTTSSPT